MSDTSGPSPARSPGPALGGSRLPRRLLHLQEGGLLLVILVLGIVLTICGGTVKVPKLEKTADGQLQRVFTVDAEGNRQLVIEEKNKFLRAENLTQLAKDTSFIAIMAVGATFIIISGGIDLSVGAIFALSAVLGALVFRQFGEAGPWAETSAWISLPVGILVCLGVGLVCGLINGSMSVLFRVHPFIITLGTMSIFRGLAYLLTEGMSITGFPGPFRDLISWELGLGLSVVPLFVMILVTVAGAIYLSGLAAGRRVYAVGGNEEASRFSGLRVNRIKMSVFILAGLTAGISALLALGYYGTATSGDGQGYELKVIAAAVVGGASLTGGRGSALGALLGALLIQMIDSGIVILGIDQNYSQVILGAVVVMAVVLDQWTSALARRRLAARAGHA